MIKKILIGLGLTVVVLALAFVGFAWWSLQPRDDPQPLPAGLVSAAEPPGMSILQEAEATADYGPLSANFVSQALRSYCGVASSVMVLSAMGKDVDQGSFFTETASDVRPRLAVTLGGMNLDDLAALLRAHGASVSIHRADDIDVQQFRSALVKNLSQTDDYVLVNYQREVLGQQRVGHISPLAAYDRETDSVLILDTAAYSYPHTWVPVESLYTAMATIDSSTGQARGYVEVKPEE